MLELVLLTCWRMCAIKEAHEESVDKSMSLLQITRS